jgi:hypothetical protein
MNPRQKSALLVGIFLVGLAALLKSGKPLNP